MKNCGVRGSQSGVLEDSSSPKCNTILFW